MWVVKLALLPALLALVSGDFPLDIQYLNLVRNDDDLSIYRLSEDILPNHYLIEITPHFVATENREAFTFDGRVEIDVTVQVENLINIVIQENVLQILGVTVLNNAGNPVALDLFNPFERLRDYHLLRMNLAEGTTLVSGQDYKIRVTYLGNINETPLTRGVFRGRYRDANNNTRWYAATHFQPTNARQAFPGFDEPGFKATFDLIINRPISFTNTFSNMPIASTEPIGDRLREIFIRTPRMPTYLLTFHISEEFEAIADNNDEFRSYRILARPNAQGQGDYAQEVGIDLTAWLEDYFNIPYYTMGENMKNDQISSPDWASGATENWGLVSYRELRLLYEEGQTNALDRQSILTITAHELAHKWFGNLITCKWWDNIWINEGFASYFEYFAAHGVSPQNELDQQFNVMYLHTSLSSDSSLNTPPLNNPNVYTPEQVTGHFGTITYAKGAALLRMLEYLVTPETFRKALNDFLVDRSYEYALPEHMYAAFARAATEDGTMDAFPGVDIAQFFQTWIDQAGYPVLDVDVNMGTGEITLTQNRFFLSSTATPDGQIWPLPLTYTVGSNPVWTQLRPTRVMTDRTETITKSAEHEWVIFNVGQIGHYRVNYDDHNWEMIAAALRSNRDSIHYLNRAQIVDDVFALMRSGRLRFELGFDVLSFLSDETNFYVWYPAITGFNWLRNRLLHLPRELELFNGFLLETLEAVVNELGFTEGSNDSQITKMNRFHIMAFACSIGHEGCVTNAVQQFQAGNVNPNLRRHVYCSGVREGGAAAYRTLHTLLTASNNQADEVVTLRALGCTADTAAINEYLEMILSDAVRAQDRVNSFTFLFMGNRENAKQALEFIKTNHNQIRNAVIGSVRFNTVLSNLAAYLDEEGLQNMEAWLAAEQASIPEHAVGVGAVASARANMAWGTAHADELMRATRNAAAAAGACALLLALTAAAVVLLSLQTLRIAESSDRS